MYTLLSPLCVMYVLNALGGKHGIGRVDIVLVDCGAPFGTGAMLPRGTLREPLSLIHISGRNHGALCGRKNIPR